MKEEVKAYNPPVPFPRRLQKAKLEEQFSRFLNMFKKIKINIPFSKALTQMPQYAKFMKDILSKKRKIIEEGVVSLTATCSAVIQKTLLEKIQDPGSFTIPCKIGDANMGKALCDSRARSVAQRLSLGELTSTTITLQMADRTLQEKSKLETDNSVSNPFGNEIPDGLETEFSVFKTLVSNFVRLNSVSN